MGVTGGVWVSGVYWGACRDFRYSWTRRGIGGIRGIGGVSRGVGGHFGGVRGVLGDGRD